MARLLRDTFESRKELADLVKSLYTLRSKAAHTGELPQNISGKLSADVLMSGAKETATAIEHFIINGHPDWDKIVFS